MIAKLPFGTPINRSDPIGSAFLSLWRNAEAGGITAFDRLNRQNGTLTGGPTRLSGDRGRVISFDGTDDYILLGNSCSIQNRTKATIIARYKPRNNPAGNAGIYFESTTSSGFTRFAIFHLASGDISAAMRDNNTGSSFTITWTGGGTSNLGKWINLVYTVNTDTDYTALYANGILVGTNTAAKGAFTSGNPAEPIAIASYRQSGANQYIAGLIDYVGILGRDLSPSEVQRIYINPDCYLVQPRSWRGFAADTSSSGAIEGSAAWTWTNTGAIGGTGALESAVAWTWTTTGNIAGGGAMEGSSAWTWTLTSALTGTGALEGTSAWTWTASGTASSSGAISGAVAWTWTGAGVLTGAGALVGSSTWTWTVSGTNTEGAISGDATWVWNVSGHLHACRRYSGCNTSDFNFAVSAEPCEAVYSGCNDNDLDYRINV